MIHNSDIDVLFINLPSTLRAYKETNVGAAAPIWPNLTLATLAGNLQEGAQARLLDLDFEPDIELALKRSLETRPPDIGVMSLLTAFVADGITTANLIRKYSPKTQIVVGGVHVTSFPLEFNVPHLYDMVVLGEGDFNLNAIISGKPAPNMFHTAEDDKDALTVWDYQKKKGKTEIIDMDTLSFPKWEMFDLSRYSLPHLLSRDNPTGLIETSRGCRGNCNFCNKNTFGRFFRSKSPEYVVEEMVYMRDAGFREIHVADDSFSQDLDRAKQIFELMITRAFNIPVSLYSGVRVDCVDREFFRLAQRAGVWSVSIGIESGNQKVLNKSRKGIKLSDIENVVCMASEAGLITVGFFMFGLDGETEETMQDTINFSKKLPLSIAKFDMLVPLPGTPLFNDWDSEGFILNKDWSNYLFHQTTVPLFKHPNLSWETIRQYYTKAHRAFYIRPGYILRRLNWDIKSGDLKKDFSLFLKALPSLRFSKRL